MKDPQTFMKNAIRSTFTDQTNLVLEKHAKPVKPEKKLNKIKIKITGHDPAS